MKTVKLADVAASRGLVGGPFGSSLVSKDYVDSGVPVIRGTNMDHGRHVGGEFVYVSPAKFERDLARNTAEPGDIVFTQRGTLGQVALVPAGTYSTFVISQSQMRLRVDPAVAVPEFVYYAATTSRFLRQIADRAITTGVPHTNLGILAELEIPAFALPQQRAIVELLGALDDKIAVNSNALVLLDELVRTEFDRCALTASESVRLGSFVDAARDTAHPHQIGAAEHYVGLEHIGRRSMWLAARGAGASVTSQKSRFEVHDVLFGKLRPYFHKVALATSAGVCSTDVLVLRAREHRLAGYALAAAATDAVVGEVTRSSEGTRMPRTRWQDVLGVRVPWPGDERAQALSTKVLDTAASAAARIEESRALRALRDALLPELMSGKLRVKDAARAVEEAV